MFETEDIAHYEEENAHDGSGGYQYCDEVALLGLIAWLIVMAVTGALRRLSVAKASMKYINNDFMGRNILSFVNEFLIRGRDLQLLATGPHHQLRAHESDKKARMRDREESGEDVVPDGPAREFSVFTRALGHAAELGVRTRWRKRFGGSGAEVKVSWGV
ncbi:hypothetical protein CC80DRAFT_554856 [Byssothecium circinans]|uniref:Uncharacterized protein n=1 Tax=Byssothecium circinans TaxID=147558 RepID=A0A6A5TAI0_9PLEO|nr:hypothetical protein CC80DRAFT_554856 [Byssothecium circinans]